MLCPGLISPFIRTYGHVLADASKLRLHIFVVSRFVHLQKTVLFKQQEVCRNAEPQKAERSQVEVEHEVDDEDLDAGRRQHRHRAAPPLVDSSVHAYAEPPAPSPSSGVSWTCLPTLSTSKFQRARSASSIGRGASVTWRRKASKQNAMMIRTHRNSQESCTSSSASTLASPPASPSRCWVVSSASSAVSLVVPASPSSSSGRSIQSATSIAKPHAAARHAA
ncbi:hypothetical protein C2845_PM15G14460 [Panicum miliaceum]|uniref:Uncharacterized protein n=1 Tax=Panicum miliaceum TaxID=4540 RepID=A0A3L6QAA9_PANMI|nr:hypothetical protein C2845_PM15G14460 [Panicum miliaceum]